MEFANPEYFYLLILLIPLIAWYILKDKNAHASIQVSTLKSFHSSAKTYKYYLRHALFVFRVLAIVFLVLAVARPQSSNSRRDVTTEGIDIVMSLDISSSMLARDFEPDRLEAAKEVAVNFISGREDDKIGLVIFSGESFTQCPLTTDHAVLINLFNDIQSGMIEDGTAIGLGLANAVNRLKDSKSKSKVVILLTDGVNNQGEIAPITAAELAKTFGIRVYTIGIGTMGMAPYPIQTAFGISMRNMPVKIDEEVLQQIADMTGGQYFRATDNNKLKAIYEQIDKLEKSKIEVKQYITKSEEYLIFALLAALFLLLEIALRNSILRNIP
ncbi:VWA domain-containing protein [Labilibaculum sp. A4]|uniref:VWA domain-containing protein n=1 Tax=Labilibaculum euxinus TaxID=2686357 RepID=A0A425YBA8_9BACT|nr:VWA domain-containing protein [Labilibaculum euxinus]MVB08191.1 VWA domain-containing protein [Labilibaculum euxinus]MWN76807.1 VWA domain-containing protein [Labilibaculum euxinus]